MIAPRKKLWSTPIEVIDVSIQLLQPGPGDIVFDMGCGDGRFLIRCAQLTGAKCVGVEIEESRAKEAQESVSRAGLDHLITIHVGNALDFDVSSATAFFLYLVPRGLRRILPILRDLNKPLRVVTYMAGFEGIEPVAIEQVTPKHQPDAKW
eukprot:CAMPEP_0185767870 /NCGR_PEP_ID=MMETSP1174-20130828/45613_1 /TAXON_ID=35687 /ORGANISM="Dictyocha speculum, Strain CCMP1381" /LENGTH=150 /DNA_ID=CAMNT_0028452241 /DNA_START=27 /DNA_END=476 /DNA_ORIENTATION=-